MLLRLAWRNVWRNHRRTIINLGALTLGVTALVTLHSFREVANAEMLRGLTEGLVGHVQIHGKGYQDSPELANVVRDPVAVEATLLRSLPGARPERRVLAAGLAGSGEAASAAMVMGIEPDNPGAEALVTIVRGRPLGAAPAKEAVIGTGLAEELGVEPGGELVLLGQAADGSLANDRFTVVGLADAGSADASASAVFLHLADAQSFFALGDGVHQILVRLPAEAEDDLSEPLSVIRGALDLQRLEVLPWTDIVPELESAIQAKRKNQHFIDVIVFLIVALGILNTMTMATLERTRELGVLMCLGTRPRRVLAMVLLEALLQGALGFAMGVVLSWVLLHAIGTVSLAGMAGGGAVMGMRLPESLTLGLHLPSVAGAALTTLVTMVAGGLFPAIRASRLQPIEATRYV